MPKSNMETISITPGATVKVEHFKHTDSGSLERNVQNEFDNRIECLMTPQVINKEISTELAWGLSGWDSVDSLEITTSAGDLFCDEGVAYIGGRRYLRIGGVGDITSEVGNPGGSANYYVRLQYTVSTDDHTFIAEASESISGNDVKYITLALVNWNGSDTWSAETDLRASNTSLPVPAFLSGDTDAQVLPVLTVTQTGATEQAFEVYGADVQFFESGDPNKFIIYGNSTDAIEIHNAAVNSGKLRAGATADTLYVDNFDIATVLDVASMTLSTTDISGALTIGDLTTITLATAGASVTLANAAPQTLAFSNSVSTLNITVDGNITASSTGSSIAGSASVGGVTLNSNDVTADALILNDTSDQITLNSAGAFNGIISIASIGTSDKTYTFPNTTGTVAVDGAGAMTVNASGQVVHADTSGYKHVPGSGATNAVLMGDGSDGSTWDATPSVSTITATATGSSIASSASVGGVTLNAGAISGVSTIGASGQVTAGSVDTGSGDVECYNLRATLDLYCDHSLRCEDLALHVYTTAGRQLTLTGDVYLSPYTDHQLDLGASAVAWDVVYRQSEQTTSYVGTFDDPIEIVKLVAWEEDDHLVHTTLPESMRTLRLNTEEEASKITGRLTGKKVTKGNAPEKFEFISDMHYDTDGMDMLLLQTLQKLIEKVEILEARVDAL